MSHVTVHMKHITEVEGHVKEKRERSNERERAGEKRGGEMEGEREREGIEGEVWMWQMKVQKKKG